MVAYKNKNPFTTFKLRSQYYFSNNDNNNIIIILMIIIILLLFLLFRRLINSCRRNMLYYSIGLNSFLSYMTFSGLFCTFIWCSSACVFFFAGLLYLNVLPNVCRIFSGKQNFCPPCLMVTMQCSGNHDYPRIS